MTTSINEEQPFNSTGSNNSSANLPSMSKDKYMTTYENFLQWKKCCGPGVECILLDKTADIQTTPRIVFCCGPGVECILLDKTADIQTTPRIVFLDQDGYVVLEDFLSPAECDELRAAGLELTTTLPDNRTIFSTTEAEKQHHRDTYFMQSNDNISYFFETDAVGEDGALKVNPSVSLNKVGHALHLLQPIFRCYTYSDRVKAVCQQLGLRAPAVVQSMYIYKNPGIGGEVIPHQDATYLYTEPTPAVGFWIALEDATLQNGCLWMASGSHKSGVHRRLVRNPDKEAAEALVYDRDAPIYPQSSFTAVPVSKGTCILIHGLVVHKSARNRSEKSRHAYTFHVVETKDNSYSPDNWLQEGSNAPFLNLYTTPQIV